MRTWLTQLPKPLGKSLSRWLPRRTPAPPEPRVIPRQDHSISRQQVSEEALKVLYRLKNADFEAYLVGGCVRDLLLGQLPKDFDVATNATPEEVRELFRNSRIVGRRFRIVHVQYGRSLIEVTTFRAGHDSADEDDSDAQQAASGLLLRDNVFGTVAQDALRRDFTINALYYSISDFSLYDFTGGLEDLRHRTLRVIGDPATRYREDPVRMLRALRFAAKLDFQLDPATAAPIRQLKGLLEAVAPARLFDEVLKLFMAGHGLATFHQVEAHDVLPHLLPPTARALNHDTVWPRRLIEQALHNTDQRIAEDKPVTPAFLYACLLWPAVAQGMHRLEARGIPALDALRQSADEVLHEQLRHITIPKRFSLPMREIWDMQLRLTRRTPRTAHSLLANGRFRAAYDFLLLRENAGEIEPGLGDWWTRFQQEDDGARQHLLQAVTTPAAADGKRRRRRPRRRPPAA